MNQKRSIVRNLALLFALACSGSADAGIVIEPFVGYMSAEFSQTITGSGTSPSLDGTRSSKGSGPTYGGRLGYGYSLLVGGVEYQAAKYTPKGGDDSADFSEINGFLGVRAPLGLRLIGSYTFSNKSSLAKGDGGYKILLGYQFLHFFSLNAEYVIRKFGEPAEPFPGVPASAFTHELKSYQFSLSFPLEL